MKNINLKKTAFVITTITLITKMFGFIKNSILAYYFGTSPVVDAYVMTFAIGTLTCGWMASLIGNFTPIFHRLEISKGREYALKFASNAHRCIMLLMVLLVTILEIAAPVVVHFLAPGFSGEAYDYTVYFFRMYLISLLFYATYRFFQEFLDCNREHVKAAIPGLFVSICTIIAIVISNQTGEYFLIFGYVIAVILECIVAQIWSHKLGFTHKVSFRFNRELKELFIMALPIFVSCTLGEINTLIDKAFASNLNSGIVSGMDYANTMKDFVFQVGTIAIATMIFPVASKMWAEGNTSRFCDIILKAINYMTLIYIPMIMGIILLGDQFIDVVFRRGRFDTESAIITTNSFIIYSLGLLALVYRTVFFKAFYSMQKTKYVLLISSFNIGLNIILNYVLVKPIGYMGLATATTVASTVCLPFYFVLFKKSLASAKYKNCFITILKSVVATTVMYVTVKFLKDVMPYNTASLFGQLTVLVIQIAAGASVYFLICFLLKQDEVIEIVRYVISRAKKLSKRK